MAWAGITSARAGYPQQTPDLRLRAHEVQQAVVLVGGAMGSNQHAQTTRVTEVHFGHVQDDPGRTVSRDDVREPAAQLIGGRDVQLTRDLDDRPAGSAIG
ncbi:hypothetical protein PV683_22010 [Streptomyces sp. AK08-01B]|nr:MULTISPECIES: hypothetical protein [unclassified Streptomyces]MDX2729749.1 hypothetical protein [Streptomyces sp. PA03-2a]MDX3768398.1 hypothetical protein [Streptomyces sp. AK08-01B]MDX3817729.1 hypothetical protein [Streptomyces sp. AK08-01A]